MSMNPAKRAKIENDLAATVSVILENITVLFETRVICMVSEDATSHRARADQISGPLDLVSVLSQADSQIISLYATLTKSSVKLPKGEIIRVELARLPAIFVRLLRVNASSPKGDGVSPSDFKSFLNQLPPLHSWAINQLARFIALSPASIIPFTPDLGDILEHILESKDAAILVDALLLIWNEPIFNDICRHLGRKVAALLMGSLTSLATCENTKLATMLVLLLKDIHRSALPLSISDSLFERVVALLIALPDQPLTAHSDEYQSILVECLAAGTVGSIPFHLSPRTALVLKMVGMLAVHPLTGHKTIMACSRALAMIEIAIRPVKAIAPIETATRLKRSEAVKSAFESNEEVDTLSKARETAPLRPAFKPELNLDALGNEAEFESFVVPVETTIEKVKTTEPRPHLPHVISAPNVLIKQATAADDVAMDDDDEPLPELFLD